MSLAEDLRRPLEGAGHRVASPVAVRKPLSELRSRTVPAAREPVPVPAVEALAPIPPVPDASVELLDRASRGVVFILTRYKQLEEHVKQLDAWSRAQIQAAESASARWQETALAAEKQVEGLQKTLEEVSRQAEVAEKAMQRDKDALTFLQDRIIASFGLGSEAHDAIKAIGIE